MDNFRIKINLFSVRENRFRNLFKYPFNTHHNQIPVVLCIATIGCLLCSFFFSLCFAWAWKWDFVLNRSEHSLNRTYGKMSPLFLCVSCLIMIVKTRKIKAAAVIVTSNNVHRLWWVWSGSTIQVNGFERVVRERKLQINMSQFFCLDPFSLSLVHAKTLLHLNIFGKIFHNPLESVD